MIVTVGRRRPLGRGSSTSSWTTAAITSAVARRSMMRSELPQATAGGRRPRPAGRKPGSMIDRQLAAYRAASRLTIAAVIDCLVFARSAHGSCLSLASRSGTFSIVK